MGAGRKRAGIGVRNINLETWGKTETKTVKEQDGEMKRVGRWRNTERRGEETEIGDSQGRRPGDNGGRDWSDASLR